MMQSVMHYFDKFFLTKMVKLKKAFFYIFACIFGFKIGTEMYYTSFESWKPNRFSLFNANLVKNH